MHNTAILNYALSLEKIRICLWLIYALVTMSLSQAAGESLRTIRVR